MTEIPIIPQNAPFSAEQRLWLNGFLAGYFARMEVPQVAPQPDALPVAPLGPLLILFGSQTGTAQALARRIGKEATGRGFKTRVCEAAESVAVDWSAEQTLLVVTSTYGDGDMPDNAQSFWDWLQTDAATAISHVHFSVLALGDRNYAEFCAAGRKIDARLEQLGAKRFYERADCDVDYEAQARTWIEEALGAAVCLKEQNSQGLQKGRLPQKAMAENRLSQEEVADRKIRAPGLATADSFQQQSADASRQRENGHYAEQNGDAARCFSKANPFPAELVKNVCLNKAGSSKEVRHYELRIEGSGLSYEAGDALGVAPLNCPELVGEILGALRCTGEELVRVGDDDQPLREALRRHFDITKPSTQLLAEVARRAPESDLPTLLIPERAADLKQWLWGRDVIDLLRLVSEPFSCAEFVSFLRKLSPRLYSIASSPKTHPNEVHLTVSAVRYESHGRKRKGVASTFLADHAGQAGSVKVFVQPSHGFKPPKSGEVPIVMVGPGTGIAPFRAFLEERQSAGAKGGNWLFFGDQRRSTDFLYEGELAAWVKTGHLTRLDVAFSRDQAEKVYVQHRMLESAPELWRWLQEGAHFYVCGDAKRMAKDVDAALHKVAEIGGGLSKDEAAEFVKKLKEERRYQRDVY